ncbi:MAG: ferric reductase-like transmembrane domain-containing protein [Candidatus Nanopelagicales bacterium]
MTMLSDQSAVAGRAAHLLPGPPAGRLLGSDLTIISGFIATVTAGLWARSGGVTLLLRGGIDTASAVGQLAGFTAALSALAALILTARPRMIERRFGLDGLIRMHRWFGIVTVVAVVLHAVLDTWVWGNRTGDNLIAAWFDLMANENWTVAASVAAGLFLTLGLTSWKRLKRMLSYETWYFVHLLGYLAVLLGFAHQLTLGSDLAADPVFYWWWVTVFAASAGVIVWSRIGSLVRPLRHRFYVTAITREAPGVGALHLTGPGVASTRAHAGQFFVLRALAPGLWWQAHPFSLSVPPNTAGLRFTIKELGDDTPAYLRLPYGTRVLLEGPYGIFTAQQARGEKVVLIGAGVGVAPLRAILEDCTADQEPIVIVRVHAEQDLVHRAELEALLATRNGQLWVLAGPRAWFARNDPFAPARFLQHIPDLAQRHAFVCGPTALGAIVSGGLRAAGTPTRNIHTESFGA